MNYYKSIKKRAYTFVIYIGMHQWDTQPMLYIGGVCPKKVGVYDLVDVNVGYLDSRSDELSTHPDGEIKTYRAEPFN